MKENNLLLAVAERALQLAADELPPYACPKSPHKFTQPQLLACLVLKAHTKQTYRATQDLLAASGELRHALGLRRVPDHSALQAFAGRLATPALIDRLLGRLLEPVGPPVENAAMDATGMEPSTASAHYRTRAGKPRKAYVKVSVVVLCGCLLPAFVVISRGPTNDKADAAELLERARAKVKPKRLLADAGYDAEGVHEFCYGTWKVRSYPPPVVHRRDGTVGGAVPLADDEAAQGLWPALACGVLHERAETDHGVTIDRPPGGDAGQRSRPAGTGLRHPALACARGARCSRQSKTASNPGLPFAV
jgi:hypothetical protein